MTREELDEKYSFDDRPIEPYNGDEDPETWAAIARWESDRSDAYRNALTECERERNDYIAAVADLTAQRNQLREALEWYADERNHFPRTVHAWVMEKEGRRFAPIYGDLGERARAALKGSTDESN